MNTFNNNYFNNYLKQEIYYYVRAGENVRKCPTVNWKKKV
jgi:hypothetical protein